jgi:hypothetical protein
MPRLNGDVYQIINGNFRPFCPEFGASLIDSKGVTARNHAPKGIKKIINYFLISGEKAAIGDERSRNMVAVLRPR